MRRRQSSLRRVTGGSRLPARCGVFELPYGDLTGYYEKRGFTVLPPGKPLLLRIPGGNGAVVYPADAHMQQMWRSLTPGVTASGGVVDGVL